MTGGWLVGEPMDPAATPAERLPALAGFPFLAAGSCAVIVGPTGGGRSSLIEACIYDAALAGLRCAYLGHEVTAEEFNARAALIAERRGDTPDGGDRALLGRSARYLDLSTVMVKAWDDSASWVEGAADAYGLVAIDPLSAVASALDFDFDNSNREFVTFYDRLIQPLTARGVAVVLVDNVGHAEEARGRAKGASAKQDKPDLTFACRLHSNPTALAVKATKVRSVRAPHKRGDEWLFVESTQQIEHREVAVVDPPTSSFRPTSIMEKVSKFVAEEPGVSKSAIRRAIGSQAKHVDLALELLIAEGYIERRRDGQKHSHHPIHTFVGTTESAESGPSLNQVSDSVAAPSLDDVPPPVGRGLGGLGSGQAELGDQVRDASLPPSAPPPTNAIFGPVDRASS